MKLELKHLKGYFGTGLKVELEEQGIEVLTIRLLNSCSIDGIKPILRPLSDLTKEIEVNGEKFVPMNFINELAFVNILGYSDFEDLIKPLGINECSFWQIEKLSEWHFDVFGLIEKGLAIDFNTLNK